MYVRNDFSTGDDGLGCCSTLFWESTSHIIRQDRKFRAMTADTNAAGEFILLTVETTLSEQHQSLPKHQKVIRRERVGADLRSAECRV